MCKYADEMRFRLGKIKQKKDICSITLYSQAHSQIPSSFAHLHISTFARSLPIFNTFPQVYIY
ncbi:MAG: hypothetical protein JWR12_2736 [Mucilaginibacter sp.]|nr:hypothetical protein [Mucilaginibacter sp.]